jgi:hypothetical protein
VRRKLNLDLKSLDKLTMLIHGDYGHGKTALAGDMLKTESEFGKVLFVNVKGEDGTLTLANCGLGENGEEVEDLKDFTELTDELMKSPIQALAIDSLKPLATKLVYGVVCGVDKLPSGSDHWGQIHFKMEQLATRLRRCAKYVMCVCPSDKSVNALDGVTRITPDLPGREAVGSAGWFDFVGFLKADTIGPDNVKRTLNFAPSASVVARQRLPFGKEITKPIQLPRGPGSWSAVKAALQAALT